MVKPNGFLFQVQPEVKGFISILSAVLICIVSFPADAHAL